ncbi:ABC transporter ATP-binding protein, partial [Myxococcus sp. CA039A]|nr:ABC transporter ATP-binding protein [Myxococcus sp. CA039A]
MRRTLLRLLRYARPHVAVLVVAFVCMAVVGVTTGAYAYLTGPALRFLLSGGEDGFSGANSVPWLSSLPRDAALWGFPLLMVVVGVVKG